MAGDRIDHARVSSRPSLNNAANLWAQHHPPLRRAAFGPRPQSSRAKQTLLRLLHRLEYVCWTAGVLGLAWCVTSYAGMLQFQHAEDNRLESLRQSTTQSAALKPGDPFGKIVIPRVGVSAMVAEGTDDGTLRNAVGHLPGTPGPDQPGTVVLAGHRDTFFRDLARVRTDDLIVLETPRAEYRYKVVRTEVADPRQIELLRSSPNSDLTLVTCFPFHYIGPAPKRFIVQALRCEPSSACLPR